MQSTEQSRVLARQVFSGTGEQGDEEARRSAAGDQEAQGPEGTDNGRRQAPAGSALARVPGPTPAGAQPSRRGPRTEGGRPQAAGEPQALPCGRGSPTTLGGREPEPSLQQRKPEPAEQ